MNTHARLLSEAIYGAAPCTGFVPVIDQPDIQGWNGNHRALTAAVEEDKPHIIIDLGVWKGQSTITLAKAQELACPDGCVIAIDTFLGSPEHWDRNRTDVHAALMFRHGRPSFYDIFLSNIILSGTADRIVPIAQTSENAAIILERNDVVPDLIHIDAAHQYEPVMRDIEVYWKLLAPGGLLMGDDFPWPGVARAVVHFTDRNNLKFSVDHPKWSIRKPYT